MKKQRYEQIITTFENNQTQEDTERSEIDF